MELRISGPPDGVVAPGQYHRIDADGAVVLHSTRLSWIVKGADGEEVTMRLRLANAAALASAGRDERAMNDERPQKVVTEVS